MSATGAPRTFSDYAVAGDRQLRAGNAAKAATLFAKAVRMGTDDAGLLGEVLGLVRRLEDGKFIFVLVCLPSRRLPIAQLARSHFALKDMDKALYYTRMQLDTAAAIGDAAGQGIAFLNMGTTAAAMGSYNTVRLA